MIETGTLILGAIAMVVVSIGFANKKYHHGFEDGFRAGYIKREEQLKKRR